MGNRSSVNDQSAECKPDDIFKQDKSDIDLDNSFTLNACNHTFENEYLYDYISQNISSTIKCPSRLCQQYIHDAIIRKFLSNKDINKYESLLISKASKQARKCLTKSCPMIVIVEDDYAYFQCSYCDQMNCLKCKKRHSPIQCACGDVTNENEIEKSAILAMGYRQKQEILSQFNEENYIPNPDSFKCLCFRFILPREGLITRNCQHTFCKTCFENSMKEMGFKCPKCDEDVNEREILKTVGINELAINNTKMVRQNYFNCKFPDCNGLWDNNNFKSFYTCPVCRHVNCLDCNEVHEGMVCESFRKTDRYKNSENFQKVLKSFKGVNCICGKFLILVKGGCNAFNCDNCGRDICSFTGKLAGNFGPNSCGCTTVKTCHPKCIHGCFPDGKGSEK